MLMRIKDGARIEKGCRFVRYYPKLNMVFDKGEVLEFDGMGVSVDFGDTLVKFLHSEIAYVINTDTLDEHHMSLETGMLVEDYRSTPRSLATPSDDPVLADFEELLKRMN